MNKRFRILVVDDEPVNIMVIESALKEIYDVSTALNGYDAITMLKEHKPDLILLDVMMPELSGFDFCCNIKDDSTFADIPIIFLTALDTVEGELRGLELGGIDYLTKPINLQLLKVRVKNHLELKERNDLVKVQRDLLARQKDELETAFARIKRLEGIIPICMYCKNIRSGEAYWQQIEHYVSDHSNALFSHEVCPTCFAQHSPRNSGFWNHVVKE